MMDVLLLPLPDWTALQRAATAFERQRSLETERALAAALQAFSERAELLGLYVGQLSGKPRLN